MPRFLTIGDLRQELGKPTHAIRYAIERYGPQHDSRIGNSRVWSADQLSAIQESIRRIRTPRRIVGGAA
jgi:hypothetical protein